MDIFEEHEGNELFDEGENLEVSNEQIETNHSDNENDDVQDGKKEVKPKRIVKNPRPKLNAELLKGPKGLGNLEKCFERVLFKGRGYEEQDLKILLKTYEHWCHRLFPKLPFKDCVETIEKLGSKGPIQTYLKKVRSGLIDDDTDTPATLPDFKSDDENEPGNSTDQFSTQPSIAEEPVELTEEQIETIRRNRERAEKLRQERLRKIQEKASVNLPENQEFRCLEVPNDKIVADNNVEVLNLLEKKKNDVGINNINKDISRNRKKSDDEHINVGCIEEPNNVIIADNVEVESSFEKKRDVEVVNNTNKGILCDKEKSDDEHMNADSDSEIKFCGQKNQPNKFFDDEDEGTDSYLPQTSDEIVENLEEDK